MHWKSMYKKSHLFWKNAPKERKSVKSAIPRFQNTSYLPEEAQQLLFRNSVRHITSVEIPIGRFPAPVGCSLALAKDP